MNSLKIKNKDYPLLSFSVSLVFHIILFFIASVLLNFSFDDFRNYPSYVQITTGEIHNETVKELNPGDEKSDMIESEKKEPEAVETNEKIPLEKKGNLYFDAIIDNADTSDLNQVYSENTLDVKIKYPAGWTYVDQNVKNKLDGVTFWSVKGNYNPPPYIHLEVKEKYLFNPSRFKYSYKFRNYTAYYNQPEELEGQVSQIIYIRTGTDEDYSFKLIMKGRDSFNSFSPVFYGIVKSFKFGSSFF